MSTATHSSSDAPGARHVTEAVREGSRKYRWVCSCKRSGAKTYEIKGLAAHYGWTHERAMNGLLS